MVNFRFAAHAEHEMDRRGLDRKLVLTVAGMPGQVVDAVGSRRVCQSRVSMGGKMYLIRVIVDEATIPATILTAYRTSKIAKYWRTGT